MPPLPSFAFLLFLFQQCKAGHRSYQPLLIEYLSRLRTVHQLFQALQCQSCQLTDTPKCFLKFFIWIFHSQCNIGSTFIYSTQRNLCSPQLACSLALWDLPRHCLDLWVETLPISLPPSLHGWDTMHTHHLTPCAKFLLHLHNFRSIGHLGKGPNTKS